MAEQINLAPFNLVEREHKDTASRVLQSLVVSVKVSGGTYTPNYSLKQALEAARKCYDVRLAVVSNDIDIPKIYHLSEIFKPVGGGYAIRFVCDNDRITWTASGMTASGSSIGSDTNISSGLIVGNWLADYPWTQASTNKPIADLLHIIVDVLDATMTTIEGKLENGSFYAVQSRVGDTITYKETAETPAAGKLYIDISDGPKLYRYDAATTSYVQIAVIRDIDDPEIDPWTP